MMYPILPILLFIPVVGIVITLLSGESHAKKIALLFSGLALAASVYLVVSGAQISSQLTLQYLPSLGISLNLASGTISEALVLMSSIIVFASIIAIGGDSMRQKFSCSALLAFLTAAIGVFVSANLLLFFIFWEIGVVTLFIMITTLGSANRKPAALKFLMYEIFSGAALLIAILLIFSQLHTLDIQSVIQGMQTVSQQYQLLIMLALGTAFITNMPVFPLHLWLPDAHAEAPTEGSMVLSGVLTKFGAYGLLLMFQMVPLAAKYSPYFAALAIFSSIYAAFVMMRERDIKRIIAYTTIVDMGIIALAISAQNTIAIEGAAFGMVAHGITIALMFLVAGSLHEIFGERDIRFIKGIASSARTEMYLFIYGTFATVGAPLTATFVSEILVFIGAYAAFGAYSLIGLVPIFLTAGYMYYVIQGFTSKKEDASKPLEVSRYTRRIGYGILVLAISVFGILPFILLKIISG